MSDKSAAIALGKALFWDQRVGSDSKTACTSCHFHAGAGTRSKNQLSPGPGKSSFAYGGPNHQWQASDFPLHQFANPDDRNSTFLRSLSVVSSSQRAFRETYSGVVPGQATDASYSQMEANFSPFFGLALQLYQATLVSDQAPFDKHAEGVSGALTAQQVQGLGLYLGKGKCVNCHGGPVFTNAAIRRQTLSTQRMTRMVMGDGKSAVYDEGFYNIGITRTADDLGVGGKDPFGNALSFSAVARKSSLQFYSFEQQSPNVTPSSTEACRWPRSRRWWPFSNRSPTRA